MCVTPSYPYSPLLYLAGKHHQMRPTPRTALTRGTQGCVGRHRIHQETVQVDEAAHKEEQLLDKGGWERANRC